MQLVREHPQGTRLFALAALTLYLELALIRLTAAEVLYLGYFANYILISVFLGIGLGFLAARRSVDLFALLPQLLLLLVAFVLMSRLDVTYLRYTAGQLYFGTQLQRSPVPIWVSLPLLFGGSALIFACVAQETARCFDAYKPIVAYSIDIGGSLFGIALFTLHSAVGGSPVEWFCVAGIAIVALSRRFSAFNAAAMLGGSVLLLIASQSPHYTSWSPYQKITVIPFGEGFILEANGVGHQSMQRPGEKEITYDFPYTEVAARRGSRDYENVLIVGAGSGSDVAYALAYGVGHVDAVEIDPEILWAGRQFHPARPYSSDKVDFHVDDGRAFMERAKKKYDLVIFALPDSLSVLSTFASVRLESFLFTVEAFEQVKGLLTDDGVFVLYNYYRQPWLRDKLATMLQQVFGHAPVVKTFSSPAEHLLCGLAIGPELAGEVAPPPVDASALATDDWPFLYMENRHIPLVYLGVMLLFVLCAVGGVAAIGGGTLGSISTNGPFLLMGAAFLLLEAKSIIQFSLLFGATWIVNSLVFFAILLSVLIANWVVVKLPLRRPWILFGLLFVALVAGYSVPLQSLLAIESTALRYLAASVVLFSPIFFANLVFGSLFKDTGQAAQAFGWNIVGTMLGGALEYTSMVLGYRNLALLVALLYGGCALWTWFVLKGQGGTAKAPSTKAA